jgi:hypothetical protein
MDDQMDFTDFHIDLELQDDDTDAFVRLFNATKDQALAIGNGDELRSILRAAAARKKAGWLQLGNKNIGEIDIFHALFTFPDEQATHLSKFIPRVVPGVLSQGNPRDTTTHVPCTVRSNGSIPFGYVHVTICSKEEIRDRKAALEEGSAFATFVDTNALLLEELAGRTLQVRLHEDKTDADDANRIAQAFTDMINGHPDATAPVMEESSAKKKSSAKDYTLGYRAVVRCLEMARTGAHFDCVDTVGDGETDAALAKASQLDASGVTVGVINHPDIRPIKHLARRTRQSHTTALLLYNYAKSLNDDELRYTHTLSLTHSLSPSHTHSLALTHRDHAPTVAAQRNHRNAEQLLRNAEDKFREVVKKEKESGLRQHIAEVKTISANVPAYAAMLRLLKDGRFVHPPHFDRLAFALHKGNGHNVLALVQKALFDTTEAPLRACGTRLQELAKAERPTGGLSFIDPDRGTEAVRAAFAAAKNLHTHVPYDALRIRSIIEEANRAARDVLLEAGVDLNDDSGKYGCRHASSCTRNKEPYIFSNKKTGDDRTATRASKKKKQQQEEKMYPWLQRLIRVLLGAAAAPEQLHSSYRRAFARRVVTESTTTMLPYSTYVKEHRRTIVGAGLNYVSAMGGTVVRANPLEQKQTLHQALKAQVPEPGQVLDAAKDLIDCFVYQITEACTRRIDGGGDIPTTKTVEDALEWFLVINKDKVLEALEMGKTETRRRTIELPEHRIARMLSHHLKRAFVDFPVDSMHRILRRRTRRATDLPFQDLDAFGIDALGARLQATQHGSVILGHWQASAVRILRRPQGIEASPYASLPPSCAPWPWSAAWPDLINAFDDHLEQKYVRL